MATKMCLFCSATKLTKEHLWPDWLVSAFDAAVVGRTGATTLVRGGVRTRLRPTNTIELTCHLVCKTCNRGWMGDIEREAKPVLMPLLFGNRPPSEISVEEQCVLAVWATLRTMVFDAFSPKEKQYFTHSDRIAFKEHPLLSPPPHTNIWLATFRSSHRVATFNVLNEISVAKDNGLHSMSAIINRLTFQVLIWKGERRTIRFAELRRRGWENVTQLMWPSAGRAVHWPPPHSLNAESYQALMHRFRARR